MVLSAALYDSLTVLLDFGLVGFEGQKSSGKQSPCLSIYVQNSELNGELKLKWPPNELERWGKEFTEFQYNQMQHRMNAVSL